MFAMQVGLIHALPDSVINTIRLQKTEDGRSMSSMSWREQSLTLCIEM